MKETIGQAIALDWYDGPLLEIALVTPVAGPQFTQLVQVETSLCKIGGMRPWQRVTMRLSRENLQTMLDLIDDKPVTDYHGEVIGPQHSKPVL